MNTTLLILLALILAIFWPGYAFAAFGLLFVVRIVVFLITGR